MIGPVQPKVGDELYNSDGTVLLKGAGKIIGQDHRGDFNVEVIEREIHHLSDGSQFLSRNFIVNLYWVDRRKMSGENLLWFTEDQMSDLLINSIKPYGPEWDCQNYPSHLRASYRINRAKGIYSCTTCEFIIALQEKSKAKLLAKKVKEEQSEESALINATFLFHNGNETSKRTPWPPRSLI